MTRPTFPASPVVVTAVFRGIGTVGLVSLLVLATTGARAVAAGPASPAAKRWYKGNLHTHSLWSDGNDFPEMIADWYRSHGYHFLAISDHNVLAVGERWMKVRDINRRGGAGGIDRYLERFGKPWVETRRVEGRVEVRLKRYEEYKPLMERPGAFLLIQGEEITDRFQRLPVHLNATNVQARIPPQHGSSVRETIRNNVRAVQAQAERTGEPILVHLNHPNFGWGITAEDLAHVVEERFFEVYNGHPGVRHRGDALHPGVERLWDIANTLRLAVLHAPPLYGLATDDSHNYFGRRGSSPGRGWVMVRCGALRAGDLVEAIERGDFYASSGVTLREVRFTAADRTLEIEIDPAEGAHYTTRFIGTRADASPQGKPRLDGEGRRVAASLQYGDEIGEVLVEVEGTRAVYRLTGRELYVRATVTSSLGAANPVWEGQKRQAWIQPVGWRVRLEAAGQPAGSGPNGKDE